MTRPLTLRREPLTELTFGELRAVAAGNTPYCASSDCYTAAFTCFVSLAVCELVPTGR
jgi:hypothetical protein